MRIQQPFRSARLLALLLGASVLTVPASTPAQQNGQRPPAPPATAEQNGHRPPGQPAAAEPQTPQPAQIDRNGVLILLRSTLLALHHANQTGNYTVLRDLGAPGFQAANTAARLGDIFASQRSQNLDLSGVAVLEPQLTVLPQIVQGGLMRMAGFFPSVPLQVNFELLFAPVEGRWRLFGISVNLAQSGPAAPSPPEPPKPPEEKPAEASAAHPAPAAARTPRPARSAPHPPSPPPER